MNGQDSACGGSVYAGTADKAFTVELGRTGKILEISARTSLLDAILEILPDTPNGCREGYCGACATSILKGKADHRDSFLTAEEQATNTMMMICVGRAHTKKLVLDL